MRSFPIRAILAAAFLIMGCGGSGGTNGSGADAGTVAISIGGGDTIALPATYSGLLPCTDCATRRITLTLRPDTVFLARTTWLDEPSASARHELGRWTIDADVRRLTLRSGTSAEAEFAILDATTIRTGPSNGSNVELTLTRAERVDHFGETLHLRGVFLHSGDGALLSECASGKRWPISRGGELRSLERAYRALRPPPGAGMLVSVEARLVLHNGDSGPREMVRIERIGRLWSSGACDNDGARPTTASTPWRLARYLESAVALATRTDAFPAAP